MSATSFPCRVCGTNECGVHFGADVCRACSAFFRRTVAKSLEYKCKKEGDCEIVATMRTMCRSCRYTKCVNVGMRTDSVQKYRDVYGKRDETLVPCISISRPLGPSMPLLERIAGHYSSLENVRLYVHNDSYLLFKNSSKRTPRSVNYKQSIEILLKELQIVADWISSSFSCFQTLPDDQKEVLLRNFYLQFVILEGGFFSCRHKRNDIWILPSGDFIDCAHPETYYHDPEGLQPMTSEDAVRMFASSFATYQRNVTDPMMRDDVDCFEFLALAALALFANGVERQTEECYEVCRRVRETIQRELLHYYESTKCLEDSGVRLANILTILPSLQRATRRFQEDVELSNVLNAYSVDRDFYDKCVSVRL